ncbi:MAG: toll/interleukin-1 receptor domain-containing protein [Sandaracinaceae bacterium]
MDVFLSYAFEQEHIADELQEVLSQAGHRTFFADLELRGADGFTREISDRIRRADLFLFLISPHAVEPGTYALSELRLAREARRRILPVMAVPVPLDALPATLRMRTILAPHGNLAAEVAHRVEELARQRRRRRGLLGLGAVVTVGAGAALGVGAGVFGSGGEPVSSIATLATAEPSDPLHPPWTEPGSPTRTAIDPAQPTVPPGSTGEPPGVELTSIAVRHQGDRLVQLDRPDRVVQMPTPARSRFFYGYQRNGDTLFVRHRSPYLRRLRRGDVHDRVRSSLPAEGWYYPELSVSVVNNGGDTVVLSEVVLEIERAAEDRSVILLASAKPCATEPELTFTNRGWGRVASSELVVGVTSLDSCRAAEGPMPPGVPMTRLATGAFERSRTATIGSVPSELRQQPTACAFGTLSWVAHDGRRGRLRFMLPLNLGGVCAEAATMMTSRLYDLDLPLSGAPTERRMAIQHAIGPGDTDLIAFRLAAERSGHFRFTLKILDIEGDPVVSQRVDLKLFVPRGAPRLLRHPVASDVPQPQTPGRR